MAYLLKDNQTIIIRHNYEPAKIIYLKATHIFKSCNISLKSKPFHKPKFTLSKINSE